MRYSDELIGAVMCRGNPIPINEITDLWKSDEYIEALYSGYEVCDSTGSVTPYQQVVCAVNKYLPL